MSEEPRVTVVVCSLNGAATIGATLLAIAAQTVADQIDLVVVDDGSTDATAAVAAQHGARVVRHDANAGLAAARNTGWQAALTPLVAFTDDDCRPSPNWIEALLAGLARHPEAGGVGGAVAAASTGTFVLRYLARSNPLQPLEANLLDDDRLPHRLALYLRRSALAAKPAGERPVSSVVGANMLFRSTLLERHGGFDERFRFGGEEEDLCRRVVRSGERLVFIPAAVVRHEFRRGIADTLRRSRAYGRGNARLFVKHEGVRPTIYPLPLAVAALLTVGVSRRSIGALVAAGVLPAALFSHWLVEAVRSRDPELLAYPFIQLAQEVSGNVGLLQEIRPARAMFAERLVETTR